MWNWIFAVAWWISWAPEDLLPPKTDAAMANNTALDMLWLRYLSADQQAIMMGGAMTMASLFGTPMADTFNAYSMATWRDSELGVNLKILEYTFLEILFGIIPNGFQLGLWLFILYFIAAPIQQSMCGAYNYDYRILWNVNACSSIYNW